MPKKKKYNTAEERLARIAGIIEDVDNRCAAADGPVTPTLQEMTQAEISEIYELASTAPTIAGNREEVRKLKRRYQIVRSELRVQLQMWEDVHLGKRRTKRALLDGRVTPEESIVADEYCIAAINNAGKALKDASKVR